MENTNLEYPVVGKCVKILQNFQKIGYEIVFYNEH